MYSPKFYRQDIELEHPKLHRGMLIDIARQRNTLGKAFPDVVVMLSCGWLSLLKLLRPFRARPELQRDRSRASVASQRT